MVAEVVVGEMRTASMVFTDQERDTFVVPAAGEGGWKPQPVIVKAWPPAVEPRKVPAFAATEYTSSGLIYVTIEPSILIAASVEEETFNHPKPAVDEKESSYAPAAIAGMVAVALKPFGATLMTVAVPVPVPTPAAPEGLNMSCSEEVRRTPVRATVKLGAPEDTKPVMTGVLSMSYEWSAAVTASAVILFIVTRKKPRLGAPATHVETLSG